MRADAQRNRERLLQAATELILEAGGEAPLDAIARRAGVGIGTLYRHFSDRDSLLIDVAHHALDRAVDAAQTALDEAADGYVALRQYMHAAVEYGVGVLNLIHPMLDHPDWTTQRTRIAAPLGTILQQSRHDALIRSDVEVSDIVFAVIRFSRPVEIGLTRADERALAHRHLDIYIDGLGSGVSPGQSDQTQSILRGWVGGSAGLPFSALLLLCLPLHLHLALQLKLPSG
jgi:AcrR family transcriptional regulator